MLKLDFKYCKFNKKGKCANCGYIVPNYNPSIETTRECRVTATDMPLIYTRDGNPCFFKNIFEEQSIFYLGSGPSLKETDLSFLSSRGILSAGVNNIAAWSIIRPNIWVISDEPKSFHEVIWKDPAIMKFIPEKDSGKPFKLASGNWARYAVRLCPNTWIYRLTSKFDTTTFLTEDYVAFGREKGVADNLDLKGSRSTMLAAIKILFYLGFRNVFLLGCDFEMLEEKPYVFPQKKKKPGIITNNSSYKILEQRLTALKPKFKEVNFNIYNCTKGSKLQTFPFLPVTDAIQMSLEDFYTEKPNLEGMYG